MSQAELEYLTRTPNLLRDLVNELRRFNDNYEKANKITTNK